MFRLNEIPVEEIARQGFTAIQTSPLQPLKERIHENLDNSWAVYQPIGYTIGNDLGTEEDLRNLADRWHRNGLKLIVDVVFRHLANERGNDVYHTIPYEYRHFYNESFINISNYNDEYELTCKSLAGLPALDLENETIIEAQFNYLKQLKAVGADGVRIDAYAQKVAANRAAVSTIYNANAAKYQGLADAASTRATGAANSYLNDAKQNMYDYYLALTGNHKDAATAVRSNVLSSTGRNTSTTR